MSRYRNDGGENFVLALFYTIIMIGVFHQQILWYFGFDLVW